MNFPGGAPSLQRLTWSHVTTAPLGTQDVGARSGKAQQASNQSQHDGDRFTLGAKAATEPPIVVAGTQGSGAPMRRLGAVLTPHRRQF